MQHTFPVCGQGNYDPSAKEITNGHEVQIGRYPWMVSLNVTKGNVFTTCGASLIDDRYIMTAAHCLFHKPNVNGIIATFSAHGRRLEEANDSVKLEIESYLIHEKFSGRFNFVYDIALIKLKNPVDIENAKWNPVCLPNFSNYSNLFLAEWRSQYVNSSLIKQEALYDVKLDEVDNSTCINKYWGSRYVPELSICAGTLEGECDGNSGGPLSTRHNGHVYQVGIVSIGTAYCGVKDKRMPGVYERITAHLDWIEQNTKDAKRCIGPDTPNYQSGPLVPSLLFRPVPAYVPIIMFATFVFGTIVINIFKCFNYF